MAGRRRGQIIARGSGKWLVRVPRTGPDGKPKPWNRTVEGTKKDAEKALTEALRLLDEGRLEDPSRMTVGEWLDEWINLRRSDLRHSTVDHYGRMIDYYLRPPLGMVRMDTLRPLHIQRALADLSQGVYSNGRPLSGTTVHDVARLLKQALRVAVSLRVIPSNPMQDVRAPRASRAGPRRVLTAQEAGRFAVAAQKERNGILLLTSLATGARPGEVLALRWEDVDFDAGVLHVRHSLHRVRGGHGAWLLTQPKTASSVRDIPMPLDLAALLRRQRAHQAEERLRAGALWRDHGFVFTTELGEPVTVIAVSKALCRALKAAGLERMSRHGLRHSAATLLILAGMDPRHVAEQLGHSAVQTTLEFYVKPSESRLREGADLLAGIVLRQSRAE